MVPLENHWEGEVVTHVKHRNTVRAFFAPAVLLAIAVAPVGAAPPGEPFKELETRVDELTERVDAVETDVKDIDDRLSEVVEVVDVAEAFDMCVRVIEGELGGLPGPHWIFSGCNVHVRAKNLATDATPNGLGNLIVGYNEGRCRSLDSDIPSDNPNQPGGFPDACLTDEECGEGRFCDFTGRQGSHNLVVGHQHGYPSFGAILGGRLNVASGRHATVAGGDTNRASGEFASVAGGSLNHAAGRASQVTGGIRNVASGERSTVVGGGGLGPVLIEGPEDSVDCPNRAEGLYSVVVGGCGNVAGARSTAVLGGHGNTANGQYSAVTGGSFNRAAAGATASVVSGGKDRIVEDVFDWRAGGKFEDD